jgi:hypothetical protein
MPRDNILPVRKTTPSDVRFLDWSSASLHAAATPKPSTRIDGSFDA